MSFIPISLDEFIEIHMKDNPSENVKVLQIKLESAIEAYKKGEKCNCGNDIWVVGSATNGFKCFQCITGKKHPAGDYEIDSVIDKIDKFGRRHIDEMDPRRIAGMFDDEGYEVRPDHIKKQSLCLTCKKYYEPGIEDEMLCNLHKFDQQNIDKFICHNYEKL